MRDKWQRVWSENQLPADSFHPAADQDTQVTVVSASKLAFYAYKDEVLVHCLCTVVEPFLALLKLMSPYTADVVKQEETAGRGVWALPGPNTYSTPVVKVDTE